MEEQDISIREFQVEDLPALTVLTNELGYPTTVEQMRERMKAISALEDYWTFVAVINDEAVGYMGLNKHYFWEQDGCFIRIQALVVNEKYRRSGVGQKLLGHAEKITKQINAKIIVLNCGNREERRSAHQFYPKMGFEPASTGYIKRLK